MFECYMGWCDYSNVRFTSQRNNFLGQVRSILGPRRCLPRGREAITRRNLPRLDAGFMLREDILSQHSFPDPRPTRHRFNPSKLGCDGLSRIGELAQAVRRPTVSGHVSAPAQDLSQGYARPQNHCAATELPKSINLSQDTSPASLKQEEVSSEREVRRFSSFSSSSSPVNKEEEPPSVLSSPETGPGSLQRNVSRVGRCPETGLEPRHQSPQGLNSAPRSKWNARAVELRASGQHFNSIANQLHIELGVRINGADVRREIG